MPPNAIIVIDFALCLLLWVVQAVIYPSFRYADAATFGDWHARYMRRITVFVLPLMIVQLAHYSHATLLAFTVRDAVALALVLVAWGVTFFWSVPCHRRLREHGRSSPVIDSLLRSNLVRAIAWSGVLGLSLVEMTPAA